MFEVRIDDTGCACPSSVIIYWPVFQPRITTLTVLLTQDSLKYALIYRPFTFQNWEPQCQYTGRFFADSCRNTRENLDGVKCMIRRQRACGVGSRAQCPIRLLSHISHLSDLRTDVSIFILKCPHHFAISDAKCQCDSETSTTVVYRQSSDTNIPFTKTPRWTCAPFIINATPRNGTT